MDIEMETQMDTQEEQEELGYLMDKMSLKEKRQKMSNKSLYNINQTIRVNDIYHVTTINMNFYQIWSIFRCVMPNVKENGKTGYLNGLKYYEYNFVSSEDSNDIFVLYSYGDSFINVKEWTIGTTSNNNKRIQDFMEHLLKALECYAYGYKGIEKLDFSSNNPKIELILQEIKKELIKNREILKTL